MRNKTKYLRSSKGKTGPNDADIDSKYLEQVTSYQYLWSTINGDISIEKEITKWIALGNKSYYTNQKMFKSKSV
jgi:hypothetical protein